MSGEAIVAENLVKQSKRITLLAMSGAGKTTLLRILAGEEIPSPAKTF